MTELTKSIKLLNEFNEKATAVDEAATPDPAAVDALMKELDASPLPASVAKLVKKARLPEDQRLVNAATCEKILALETDFNKLKEKLESIQTRFSFIFNKKMVKKEKGRKKAEDQEALAAFSDREAAAREAVEAEEVQLRDALREATEEQLVKVRKFEKRAQHHVNKKSTAGAMAPAVESKKLMAHALATQAVSLISEEEAAHAELFDDESEAREACEEEEEQEFTAVMVELQEMWMALVAAFSASTAEVVEGQGPAEGRFVHSAMTDLAARTLTPGSFWTVADRSGPVVALTPAEEVAADGTRLLQLSTVALQLIFGAGPLREDLDADNLWKVQRGTSLTVPSDFEGVSKKKKQPTKKGAQPHVDPSRSKSLAIILAHGGYFAAGVFDAVTQEPLVHKTFQRYITRKGQGGRQSGHNGRTDTAGSQLRAAMEKKWTEEVNALLTDWVKSGVLHGTSIIMVHAPGRQNRAMISGSSSPLGADEKLRGRIVSLPVAAGRPTLKEATDCLARLLNARQWC